MILLMIPAADRIKECSRPNATRAAAGVQQRAPHLGVSSRFEDAIPAQAPRLVQRYTSDRAVIALGIVSLSATLPNR